jgi:peptidoglycan hydrolase-like protein with peptidoglycan-binding domain
MSNQIQPWSVLRRGRQGHPVPTLQYLLRDRGHLVTVDGIFGPKTVAAVRGFQQALGTNRRRDVGPLTWRALVSGMLSF